MSIGIPYLTPKLLHQRPFTFTATLFEIELGGVRFQYVCNVDYYRHPFKIWLRMVVIARHKYWNFEDELPDEIIWKLR